MSYQEIDPRSERDHGQKCKYLISEIKKLDKKLARVFSEELAETPSDETWELFLKLKEHYAPLSENVNENNNL